MVFNASFISPSSVDDTVLINCVVKNYSGSLYLSFYGANGGSAKNCTFVNINNFVLAQTDVSNGKVDSCVFQNCNISSSDQSTAGGEGKIGFTKFIYSLFFQCNFMLRGGVGNGGVVYPGVPAGYTAYTNIATLQADFRTAYGTNSFTGCNIADPLFNNYNIGDYSLQFNSPAKNLTYFGTYVGAKSIAYAVKASATEANGAFDFSTNINLTIADDSITLTDQTQNGEVKTNLIVNTAGRQIQRFPIYGFNADRNGQYIDSIPDLGTVYYTAGQAVNSNTPYLVEGAAITCNGNVYQVGDRLTIPTGVTAFTGDGTLREILEAPERHTIKMRCSDGLAAVANGAAAVAGYWYYVVSGNATYNGNVINAGSSFKAVDTNAIGVNGSVELAFDNTDTFQHYEPGIQPTTNNVGDVRKGEVLRGNGDPAYVRGGYGIQEFPVNPKYIQLYYIIRVSELTP